VLVSTAQSDQRVHEKLTAVLTPEEAHRLQQSLHHRWHLWARPKQLPPNDDSWDVLGLIAGRGGGKTRPGSQWVIEKARLNPSCRIALVGRTAADVRDTMVLGESGILACSPIFWFRPEYVSSKRLILWPNGSEAHLYSAEKPDLLRGPQFHFAWGDEFATWKRVRDDKGGDAWSNLQDALRLGKHPQVVLTTTPRPTDLVFDTFLGPRDERGKRPITEAEMATNEWTLELPLEDHLGRHVVHRTVVRRWSTEENALNLAPGFIAKRRAKYAGTRLGAQELDAAFLLASENALWRQEDIDLYRVEALQSERERLIIAVDPTRSEFRPKDECGIIAACRCKDQHGYVLEDGTLRAAPYDWAARAVGLCRKYNADAITYEQRGLDRSTEDTIRIVAEATGTRWEPRTSSLDKKGRAEPVSALYRAGRVHHVNPKGEMFEFLEDEMIMWDPTSRWSPNRLDALVWAMTDLLLSGATSAPVVVPGSITGERGM
jgi:phage terminase large subunit-like protein